jgi:hypothetical protein
MPFRRTAPRIVFQPNSENVGEGFWIPGNEIGLVTVDALVVSGVERAGFFWIEREIGVTTRKCQNCPVRENANWTI